MDSKINSILSDLIKVPALNNDKVNNYIIYDYDSFLKGKSSQEIQQLLLPSCSQINIMDFLKNDKNSSSSVTSNYDELNYLKASPNEEIKNTDFDKNNTDGIKEVSNSDNQNQINTTNKLLNKKVEKNKQSTTGNCWLLSAINTYIDDGENALKDIIQIKDDNSATVKFKPCTLDGICKKDGTRTNLNVTNEPIEITATELNADNYKGKKLSIGDADVKAIEIAWYKLCERNFGENVLPQDFQTNDNGLKLLYGDNVKIVTSILGHGNAFSDWWHKYAVKGNTLQNLDFSKISKNATLGTCFGDPKISDNAWASNLKMAGYSLIAQGYDEDMVDAAVKNCKKRCGTTTTGLDAGSNNIISIPYRDKTVDIYGQHVYTYLGTEMKFTGEGTWGPEKVVKLINPHDNSEVIEIPEIYAKLLFNQIAWTE